MEEDPFDDDLMWALAAPSTSAAQSLDWLAPDSEEEDCASGALSTLACTQQTVVKESVFDFPCGLSLQVSELVEAPAAAAPLSRTAVGGEVWEAALLLATHLCCTGVGRDLVVGRRIHEIGAGVGLPGLAALAVGAADVVLSDYPPHVVDNLCANARRNPAPAQLGAATARAIRLDWRDVHLDQPLPLPEPDPEPEPQVSVEPLSDPELLPQDMRIIVHNLTQRADLNYPTLREVRAAFQQSGGMVQLHLGEAVDRLRKAARERPARDVTSTTSLRDFKSGMTSDWEADVVIGAALVYGPHHAESLATCIARLLQPAHSGHGGAVEVRKRAFVVQIPTRPVRATPQFCIRIN
jgi:predicted nicotinamide N-methyase